MKWVGPGVEGVGFALGINEAKRTLLRDLNEGLKCVMPPLGVPISTGSGLQEFPDISGNIVVWTDSRRNIRGYNIATKREFQVSSASAKSVKYIPSVSGNIVVWGDTRNGNGDIFAYDLRTGAEFPVTVDPHNQWSPKVSGNIVVWEDDRNGNLDIYGYDLNTQTEFQITTDKADQGQPRISGNLVIWEDRRNDHHTPSLCPGPRCDRNPDAIFLYGYDLRSMTEFPLPFRAWVIDGDLVAGTQDTPLGGRISVFNIRSQEQVASWLVPRQARGLAISGNIVVWQDNRDDTFHSIYGYNLRAHTEFLVAKGVSAKNPAIYGDFVVWEANRNSYDFAIYAERISNDKR
jgi:beta propeller repeat protein